MDNNFIDKSFPGLFDHYLEQESQGFNYENIIARIVNDKIIRLANQSSHSECILNDRGDCNHLIKAHAIQNNGILNKLAENGKVIYIGERSSFNIKNPKEHLVGRNEATTFKGFCKIHDEIFNPIEHENYSVGNLQQNFLFAYRAFARAYNSNFTSAKFFENYIQEMVENPALESLLEKQAGKGLDSKETREFKKKVVIARQEYRLKQLREVERDFNHLKIILNTNLHNERYNKIQTEVIEIPVKNTIASSSLAYIYADLHGHPFNKLLKFPSFLTLIPQGNTTYFLFSYLSKHKHYFKEFINQLRDVKENEIELVISNLFLKYGDNLCFSPQIFEKFSQKEIDMIGKGINRNTQFPGEKLLVYPVNIFRPLQG